MTQNITSLQKLSLQCLEISDEDNGESVELIHHSPQRDTVEEQRLPLHEGVDQTKNSITDEIIREAKRSVESQRQIHKKTDERAQQIVQNAIKSSKRREAQLKSTHEVVKLAEKDIPSETEKLLCKFSKLPTNQSKSRAADETRKINEEIARKNREILSRKRIRGSFSPAIIDMESFSTITDNDYIETKAHQSERHPSPPVEMVVSAPSHVQISSPKWRRPRRSSSTSIDNASKSIPHEAPSPDSKPPKSMPRDTPPRMALGVSISEPKGQLRRRSKDPKKVSATETKSNSPSLSEKLYALPKSIPSDTPPRMSLGPSVTDTSDEQQWPLSSERSTNLTGSTHPSHNPPQSISRDTPPRLGLSSITQKLSDDNVLESISLTHSSNSVDEYEKAMGKLPGPSKLTSINRENMLNLIDGIRNPKRMREFDEDTADDDITTVPDSPKATELTTIRNAFSSYLGYFLGRATGKTEQDYNKGEDEVNKKSLQNFSPLADACGAIGAARDVVEGNSMDGGEGEKVSTIETKVLQQNYSFTETIQAKVVDPHMPSWISHLVKEEKKETEDLSEYFFVLGESRTVIVHEIMRGNWTWCTAWSPDGLRLAIATENHHLAVIDTSSSTVWRVKYDKRIMVPTKNHTTHSIRSIAWGSQFIAIGGTGNAVSILSPIEPYPIIHTIKGTGFVGSLAWRLNSTILAVGSREDKCSIYFVTAAAEKTACTLQSMVSQEIYTVTRKDWVNAVSFSPDGSVLAVGDRSGKLSVYSFEAIQNKSPTLEKISHFKFSASVLDIEWSPDGKWLYAGGEDFAMTVLDTTKWEVVHTMARDRWIQFISSSHRGTHVAIGGGTSEVTILDAMDKWKKTLSIELKGLVPLSAKWHPKDQFLALTGQDNSIMAIETTNARHIKGHYLQSISPVLQVDFSPDGQVLAVGNEAGVVSFYRSNETSFVTTYEIFLANGASQSIVWSPNGSYVMVGSGNTLSIIGKANSVTNGEKLPPSSSGLGIRKVIRDLDTISTISIHGCSRFAALVGESISILDAANDFNCVKRWDDHEPMKSSAWSLDGTWLATTGLKSGMVIFDTSDESVAAWHTVFTFDCEDAGNALAWGPSVVEGLQYLAFGGENKKITIIEIRTSDGTWETVLEVCRNGAIHALDWSETGLLAAAIGDGTVTIIDLGYLKSGWAVNEMDYNWQRQGITCFTEIRRNQGVNAMQTIRWIPSRASEEALLAIGGSDGALEVVDLTERSHCKGFGN